MYASSEEQEAKDNVVSASCRVMQYYPSLVPLDIMIQFVLSRIPFTGDVNENETVLRYAFNLNSLCKIEMFKYYLEPEKIQPYMQNIAMTCIKVLVDEKCDEVPESFKLEVAKFIKGVLANTHL